MQDLRYALRGFRKQPVFSVVAILTLTLGVGATTAVFSVLYQVLLKPLPYSHADRLVAVDNVYLRAGNEPSDVAIPDYMDRRTGAPAVEDATLFAPRVSALDLGGNPEQILGLAVTPSFFTTLGRGPALGRAFVDADVAGGVAAKVVVLTDATWRTRFGGDPSIVGRAIRVNGEAQTVIGVLPRDFEVPWRDAALLFPFAFTSDQMSDAERGNEFSRMIARLRPGATVAQLDAQMDAITAGLMTRVPSRAAFMQSSGFTGRAVPLQAMQTQSIRTQLYIVQAAVVLVLLIACANVGNLLLMRTAGRQRELAIRTAIGAGRRRIATQMLIEGLTLAAVGGVCGIALSIGGVRGLVTMAAEQLPLSVTAMPDGAVLAFAVCVTVLTGIVFGVVPAAGLLRASAGSLLKEDTSRGTAGRRGGSLRRALVVTECAVALVLVVGAGLLVKSFAHLTQRNAGFNPEKVLTAQIALQPLRYPDADTRRAFWQRVLTGVKTLPGITSSGLVGTTPFSGELDAGSFTLVGRPAGPGEKTPHANQDRVGGDYFTAMQIPLRAGRFFSDRDDAQAPRVAIVDDLLIKEYFPDGDAVGRQINFGGPRNYRIVGVVGTVNASDLAAPVSEGRIYLSAAQVPPARMGLVIKTAGTPESVVPAIRALVKTIDPEQPIAQVRDMDAWIERSLQPRRTPTVLLALFGACALVLAAIGIYGVLAFGVSQRLREFGIRQALGAQGSSILALVLREGLMTAALGLAIGTAAALILARGMRSLLVDVPPGDPAILGASALVLMSTAACAAWLPARRATKADPITILRSE
jgi:predicted permease